MSEQVHSIGIIIIKIFFTKLVDAVYKLRGCSLLTIYVVLLLYMHGFYSNNLAIRIALVGVIAIRITLGGVIGTLSIHRL